MTDTDKPLEPDHGLRRLLIWVFIALVFSVALAFLGVQLAIRWFDPG